MNGSAKSLTHEMLAKLFKGNASISLLPYTSAGVTWAGLSFEDADQIFTLRDSFQISQADPSVTEIQIDQMDEVIDTDTQNGEWTMAGNVPSLAQEVLEVFFKGAAYVGNKAVVTENTAQSSTSIKIKKGSGITGATSLTDGDATFTVTAINTSADAYDTITVSSTSKALKAGDILYKASDVLVGQNGKKYAGRAFFATPKDVYATILVENLAETYSLAFAKVKMTAGISKDDATNPGYLKLSISILANDEPTGTQGDFISGEGL